DRSGGEAAGHRACVPRNGVGTLSRRWLPPDVARCGTARRGSSGGAMGGSIRGRFGVETLEERGVVVLLGMPEHAEREALRRVLDALERPVLRPGRLAQVRADPPEALVVVGLHRRAVAEQRAEPALGIDAHAVRREDARRLAVLRVADDLRQVLDEVPAAGDVQE